LQEFDTSPRIFSLELGGCGTHLAAIGWNVMELFGLVQGKGIYGTTEDAGRGKEGTSRKIQGKARSGRSGRGRQED
jgi:hypothetical protein